MLNKVTLLGNVGTDPKVGGNDASRNCTFSFATTEKYTKNNGDVVESTEWHRIVTFGRLADFVSRYVTKGKQMYIEGKIHTRSYKDDNNVEHYVTEIIANEIKLLGKKND